MGNSLAVRNTPYRALAVALLAVTAVAGTAPAPWTPVADLGADGLRIALDPAALDAIASERAVTLVDVALPQGAVVDLVLERVLVAADGARIVLDGAPLSGVRLEDGLSLWEGRVDGVDGSEVFLALSASGSRGWIRTDDSLVHLVARPDAALGWSAPEQRLVSEARLRELVVAGAWSCGLDAIEQPFAERAASKAAGAVPGAAEGGLGFLPILEAEIAIETDTALFELFGDLDAVRTYMVTLFGAVSARYKEQLGIVLTVPYLGLWSGPDPWTSPDVGASSVDMLFEFTFAWNAGDAPERADAYHFVSGADLGGGVAFLNTVCNQDYGFAVSGNLAGLTPFPVEPGPLNWDFVVVAHELGHNFGTPHTHDYCPPLDQCSPFFGPCQTEQVCVTEGTLMGYCHLCPGGMENVTTYFHPVVQQTIREYALQQGLTPFTGILEADLGQALAGASTPHLDVDFVAPRAIDLLVEDAPPSVTGALVWSPSELSVPFKGGVMVPDSTLVIPVRTFSGTFDLRVRVPDDVALPEGADYWMQLWFPDAAGQQGWASTNGVQIDLVLADPLPEPLWIAHPTNGFEYALSNPGTYFDTIAEAAAHGGTLAAIDSAELNDWIAQTFVGSGLVSFFIGYDDIASEGTFTWQSGAPAGYENWGPGEPDNGFDPSGENATEFLLIDGFGYELGEWNDWTEWGWFTNHALLQRPIGAGPAH